MSTCANWRRCSSPWPEPGRAQLLRVSGRTPAAQRPKRRAKNPPPLLALAASFSAWVCLPLHHCPDGTWALTWEMCWPQPAHVVFSHTLQRTGRHMVCLLPVLPLRQPRGLVHGKNTLGGIKHVKRRIPFLTLRTSALFEPSALVGASHIPSGVYWPRGYRITARPRTITQPHDALGTTPRRHADLCGTWRLGRRWRRSG